MLSYRRYASAVAVFATALYLALLVAVFGLIALATGREPVSGDGPLLGPIAAAAAVAVVLAVLLLAALRTPREHVRGSALRPLVAGIGAYLAYAVFTFGFLGWYAVAAGLIALVVVLLFQLVIGARFDVRGRPRWPWENDDETDA